MNRIENICYLHNDEEWQDKKIDWDYVLTHFEDVNKGDSLNYFLELHGLPKYYKGVKTPPRTVKNIVNCLVNNKGLKSNKVII